MAREAKTSAEYELRAYHVTVSTQHFAVGLCSKRICLIFGLDTGTSITLLSPLRFIYFSAQYNIAMGVMYLLKTWPKLLQFIQLIFGHNDSRATEAMHDAASLERTIAISSCTPSWILLLERPHSCKIYITWSILQIKRWWYNVVCMTLVLARFICNPAVTQVVFKVHMCMHLGIHWHQNNCQITANCLLA
jgi:hypothetical protein